MEVLRSKEGIFVSQRNYTIDLLIETSMLGCRHANTLKFNYKLENSSDKVPIERKISASCGKFNLIVTY